MAQGWTHEILTLIRIQEQIQELTEFHHISVLSIKLVFYQNMTNLGLFSFGGGMERPSSWLESEQWWRVKSKSSRIWKFPYLQVWVQLNQTQVCFSRWYIHSSRSEHSNRIHRFDEVARSCQNLEGFVCRVSIQTSSELTTRWSIKF